MMISEPLYSIQDLHVEYETRLGAVQAVDSVSFDIQKGEVLGLVGESGCGKSTLGKALLRMIEPPGRITAGKLLFDGIDLMDLNEPDMRQYRGNRIGMIFQDPMTSLNPVQSISNHLTEAMLTHGMYGNEKEARINAEELIDRMGIRPERIDDYPHQLSGGMRQRVMIALALALNADMIIADEATTSLDVIVEAQFLDLLRKLRDEFDLTIILITHNIGVVAELADRVAVMYAGRIAELGTVYEVFGNALHPYSQGLMQSVPNIRLEEGDSLYKMAGEPPNLLQPPAGCRYHPRCPQVMDICSRIKPTFQSSQKDHYVSCWLYEEHPEGVERQGVKDEP
jgi:oligopeptide/dipeptide ABC transporter ATP-binding protein